MNNYEKLDLYPHNIESSQKALSALKNGQRIVAIIQATGTGKTYDGLELSLEFKGKKILWVTPANAINEHIEKIINDNPNLSLKEDFPNLQIRTYQSFVNLTREELENIECDFLIIDEIQHLTAPVWGERMRTIVKTHPNMKVLGLTAYTTNYRGTIYERDVTAPETDEIFSDAVVSEYDLYDAIIDGVLPKPILKSVITEESEMIVEIKEKIAILKNKRDKTYLEYQKMLDDIIRMIHTQNGVKKIIQQTVKPGGKYIYYCPINSEEGKNDIDSIMDTMMDYLKEKHPNQKIVFYKTTSADGKIGKYNRECFYNDVDLDGNDVKDCIRIIFAINQYNLGVHAPNVNGVFLGRRTRSDIVAFEQIGRALSVRGDTTKKIEEYTKYSLEELLQIASDRGIQFEENTSKEQLIELLVAPIIIDLADNIEFLEELETNLGDRVKEIREQGPENKRIIKITDTRIDISVINKDLLLVLRKLRENLRNKTWDDTYNLLVAYYNKYGNSEVPQNFITIDGITKTEKGEPGAVNLYNWCYTWRQNYNKLSEERKKRLEKVDFRIKSYSDIEWERKYNLLVAYFQKYGNTEVPPHFKTIDGVTPSESEEATKLWDWCCNQRRIKLSKYRRKKLEKLYFRFENKHDLEWIRKYNVLVSYYEKYGNTEVPTNFITKDGINIAEKDEEGAFDLRNWCNSQRIKYGELSESKRKQLEKINFRLEDKHGLEWERKYNVLVSYYKKYGNTEVPYKFITKDGINTTTKDEEGAFDLRIWCDCQRRDKETLLESRKEKLKKLNFRFEDKDELEWERKYNLLVAYYQEYGNTEVPTKFITKDGITVAKKEEENAVALGIWCSSQRQSYNKLSKEKIKKLELIGFRFITRKDYKTKITELCDKYNLDYKRNKFLMKMPYQELYAKIEYLMDNNLTLQIDGKINPIFSMSNVNMQMQYGISKEELITKYYLNKGKGV